MQQYIDLLTSKIILGNPLWEYLWSLCIFIAGLLIVLAIKFILFKKMASWAKKTNTPYDDLIAKNMRGKIMPLLYFTAFYVSIMRLNINDSINRALNVTALALFIFFSVRFIMTVVIFWFEHYWERNEDDSSRKSIAMAMTAIFKVILWSTAILIFLDNLGIKISAIIAGMGIGGVAVAFAAQALLGDIFSYFSILLDHPFEIGDFIIVENHKGTVEYIGIKTTRLRSLDGEQLIFSNTDLTGSRLQNYKRMERRRVMFRFGVTYETTVERLKEIPAIVKEIIDAIEIADFDRTHFLEYGDFSLNFEVVYFVNNSEYEVYCGVQQEINLKLKEELDSRKVEFAYPTSTVYVKKS